jgi:hypothetical protein
LSREVDWEEFGRSVAEAVIEAVDYWCSEVTGDDPLSCFESHMEMGLYDLAGEFVGYAGISERDLELLEEMPDEIYDKYEGYVRREIERVVVRLEREYRELCWEVCRDECGEDKECIEECMEECMRGGRL